MTEAEAEALEQILVAHWDDDIDFHTYTTRQSMQDALVKAFKLGAASLPQPLSPEDK